MTDEEKIIKNREYTKKHRVKMMNDPVSKEKMEEANRVGARAYYHKHKNDPGFIEKCRIIGKRYRTNNKEALKERQLIYRINNREKTRARNRACYARKKADGTLDINKKRKAMRDWRINNPEMAKATSARNNKRVKEKKNREIKMVTKESPGIPMLKRSRKFVKIINYEKSNLISRFAVHRAEIIMRLKARKAFNEGVDAEKKVCDNLE